MDEYRRPRARTANPRLGPSSGVSSTRVSSGSVRACAWWCRPPFCSNGRAVPGLAIQARRSEPRTRVGGSLRSGVPSACHGPSSGTPHLAWPALARANPISVGYLRRHSAPSAVRPACPFVCTAVQTVQRCSAMSAFGSGAGVELSLRGADQRCKFLSLTPLRPLNLKRGDRLLAHG
jgi:hypothetical protein